VARTDKLPPDPGLPRQDKAEVWLNALTVRLYSLLSRMIDSTNLLIDGYVLTVAVLPTASSTHRGRLVYVQGGVGARDRAYICLKADSGAFSWVEFANGGA